MATTSETPCFPPPSPTSPRLAATPRSARPRTPSRLSLSPNKCHVSPSKSRNTPVRSSATSPRKSPTKNHQNVKSVSFTPQRNKQPPRAWERRPATPFVPRDEKQKIWKRVPLGEIGVDVNRPVGISRRQQEASKDYARVVKKLKIAHNAGQEEEGEDKENVNNAFAVDMKVLNEDGHLKRGAVENDGTPGFVSMRMEDDEIEGSPKKKLRQPMTEQNAYVKAESGQATEGLLHFHEREHDLEHNLDEVGSEQEANSANEDIKNTLEGASVIEEDCEPPNQGQHHLAQGPQEETVKSDLFEAVRDPVEDQRQLATLPVDINMTAHDPVANDAEASGAASSPEQTATKEEVSGDELRSSSPPTILAENVTVDELEARESPTPARTKTIVKAQSHESSEERDMKEGSATQDALHRRVSDDDTAFLRAFMSRTKATKAERAAQDQTLHSITQDGTINLDVEQEQTMTRASDGLAPATKLEPVVEEKQEDTAPSSPLRRSKRAVVTSIPRPQALPNSISLKRANGNEFIFKANQASSTANAAMATRSNTKKNKGTALNVPARLEQILAEKAKEQSAEIEPSVEGSTAMLETSNGPASKKRKRDKNDTRGKVRKVLRWNDENLVSYQEADQNANLDDTEDSSQDGAREEGKENHEPNKHVKVALTLSFGENVSTEEGKTEEQAKKDTEKVRRVRRGIGGSVNGTPAPKTRSQSMMESDGVDVPAEEGPPARVSEAATATVGALAAEEPSQSASTSAREKAAAATAMTRKSRMPVASVGSRRAVASASVKNSGSSLPARVTAASSRGREKSREGEKTMSSGDKEMEGERGDVLGKRRLRVRS
ncbi:hypothetical protein LTR70_002318 [Exophiala xenobiotica]|uniref:Uncharacterized protein n=1 Tax=Lithohypha guttulata TaxID=1690604 RepID=A0ABR0KL69_9EURO|nr:hypothetical protein LTR24_001260 [Lithohypha guttulata]KAK5326053.1 hypothetical protein LTR70_002318 [Exophiala xenobiotica]